MFNELRMLTEAVAEVTSSPTETVVEPISEAVEVPSNFLPSGPRELAKSPNEIDLGDLSKYMTAWS